MLSSLIFGTCLIVLGSVLFAKKAITRHSGLQRLDFSTVTEPAVTEVPTEVLEDALQTVFSDSMDECEGRELKVLGKFPAWLENAGVLLRNGPGCFGEQEADKGTRARRSVSYTHLTLPTICSV